MTDGDESKLGLGSPWLEIVMGLRQVPQQLPSTKEVKRLLRRGLKPPKEVVEFLDNIESGKLKLSKGRPRNNPVYSEITARCVYDTYEFIEELLSEGYEFGESTAMLERIQEMLAGDGLGLGLETIRDIVHGRKPWEHEWEKWQGRREKRVFIPNESRRKRR